MARKLDRSASAPGQSAAGVREYDSVRVVRLRTRTRPFDGTAPMARLPRVGDIATVAHEYDPDDPGGTVAVEMTDADGSTIWLADFDKDELECIHRPEPG